MWILSGKQCSNAMEQERLSGDFRHNGLPIFVCKEGGLTPSEVLEYLVLIQCAAVRLGIPQVDLRDPDGISCRLADYIDYLATLHQ